MDVRGPTKIVEDVQEWWILSIAEHTLAQWDNAGNMYAWDARTQTSTPLLSYFPPKGIVTCACMITPDRLAFATVKDTFIFDLGHTNTHHVMTLSNTFQVQSMCATHREQLLIAYLDRTVRVWNLKTRSVTSEHNFSSGFSYRAQICHVTSSTVAHLSNIVGESTLVVFDLISKQRKHTFHSLCGGICNAMCMISPGHIACGGTSGIVQILDVHNGVALSSKRIIGSMIYGLLMVSPGMLAASSYEHILLLDVSDPCEVVSLAMLQGHTLEVTSMCLLSDGVFASRARKEGVGDVLFWDVRNIKRRDTPKTKHTRPLSFDAYTTYVLYPYRQRLTFNQSAFRILCKSIARNRSDCKTDGANGYLDLPIRPMALIYAFV